MAAVPRQQVIHFLDGGGRDMQRVGLSFGRNTAIRDQLNCEPPDSIINCDLGNILELVQTLLCRLNIAGASLGNDQFRRKQLILRTLLFPPLGRNLLPSCDANIPARTGSEITNNRRFNINSVVPNLAMCDNVP